jgi:hypothetical protein
VARHRATSTVTSSRNTALMKRAPRRARTKAYLHAAEIGARAGGRPPGGGPGRSEAGSVLREGGGRPMGSRPHADTPPSPRPEPGLARKDHCWAI